MLTLFFCWQQTVYMSLGEDQEELPISWAQLEQDLEFDEEITSAQTSSIIRDVISKKKTKPKLVSIEQFGSIIYYFQRNNYLK